MLLCSGVLLKWLKDCCLTHRVHPQQNIHCIISAFEWTQLKYFLVLFSFLFFSLPCAVNRLLQSTVDNSVEIQYSVVFGCRLNAIYCCSTLFKWPAFWRQKQQSVFHCMESQLQPPATTWQLKTAHYKKTENPCLMFLLSEGGTAISSYPSQAFPL